MVEAKTRHDSRQRRLHKIATTLERELHVDVFRFKFKNVFWRVRLVKPKLFDQFRAFDFAVAGGPHLQKWANGVGVVSIYHKRLQKTL